MSPTRPEIMRIQMEELELPAFFPSVSSVKTSLRPFEYLGLLNSLPQLKNRFLISAFDLAHSSEKEKTLLMEMVSNANESGATVLMDSGNYESYWKGQANRWSQDNFHQMLTEYSCALAFSFDEHNPPADLNEHVEVTIKHYLSDQAAGDATIIPILHREKSELPALCRLIAEETGVSMLAVAERWLGDGVFDRAAMVSELRRALNQTGRYVGLHLLGTGNPISKAIYTIAGADSFDGLEWCQTVVDHDSAQLHHLSHSDFYRLQTKWGESELSFQTRTLAHNLEFYSDWMTRLRESVRYGSEIEFCRLNFPKPVFAQCAKTLAWEKE